ncbi:unnamed protein product, partial [Trichogramma brassicae]
MKNLDTGEVDLGWIRMETRAQETGTSRYGTKTRTEEAQTPGYNDEPDKRPELRGRTRTYGYEWQSPDTEARHLDMKEDPDTE